VIKVERIACNACCADDAREIGGVKEWHIRECRRCGLVFVSPVPFFEPNRAFSEMSLSFQYTRFQRDVTPEVLRHDEDQFRRQAAIAAGIAGRPGPGRFLDLGCGSGATVSAATRQGWDAIGIDIDPTLVEIGRRELGADLRCGTLPDPRLQSEGFDFIRLRDVIEHLPNPYDVLVEIERLLAPGGVLLVATPNEGGMPARMRAMLRMRRTVVASVPPPHHLHGFAPATLRLILERARLDPVRIVTTTPVDATYVTARNMRSADTAKVAFWRVGRALGMGSMLVAWAARRRGCAAAATGDAAIAN
jgi:2-polyprenyl-3-methyl-5-hydroxy-6-metoxy-1,4-benzoquinol methylase